LTITYIQFKSSFIFEELCYLFLPEHFTIRPYSHALKRCEQTTIPFHYYSTNWICFAWIST